MFRLASWVRSTPIIALLIFSSGDSAVAASGEWSSLGPDGGFIQALVIDPQNPSILYAGTERGTVYKSTDAAGGWQLMNGGFPPDQNVLIDEMVIDPNTPQILYLATSWGVIKSADGAESWQQMNQGISDNDIESLAIAPANSATLYAGTGSRGVFKSIDAGANWVNVFEITTSVDALAVAPSNSSTVYLGTGINEIYKSTDGGTTWSPFSNGLDNAFVFNQIAVHPTNPDRAYAASDNGLFRTTNGGNTWSVLNTPDSVIESVVLDPSNPMTVYATSDSVIKSTDGGDTWLVLDNSVLNRFQVLKTVAVDPASPATLYAVGWGLGSEALFKSTDGGTSWLMSYSGLRNINVFTIAFDPQNPSTIYAGAGEGRGGIHKSTDGGQTWELRIDPPAYDGFTRVQDIVVDPLNSSNVYAGTVFGGGILWSDDGAETWNAANALSSVNELGIHPTDTSNLYAAHFGGVYKSIDRARNWQLAGNGLPDNVNYTALAVDPSDGDTVYTGSTPGFGGGTAAIYKTTNGGDSWVELNNGFELDGVTALEIAPGNPSTIYAGGPGGKVQISTDGGESWMALNTGFSQFWTVSTLAIDPLDSSFVYAGTDAGGVFMSMDGGSTWVEYSQGLPHVTIHDLAIHPANTQIVLTACFYYSVFRYESLSPQWLFTPGDPAGSGDRFDGLAFSNYSTENAVLKLEFIDPSTPAADGLSQDGSLESPLSTHVTDLDLPAGEQVAKLRSELFEGNADQPAWIELNRDNPDIASFFQFGTSTLTQLDGGVAIGSLSTELFFQRVFDGPAAFRGQGASTRLTVLNPGNEPVTIDLDYFPPEDDPGGQPLQATRIIPGRSFLDETASELFGSSLSGGYVAGHVTEGSGVAGFEIVQLPDRPMVLGLNASTPSSATRSFSAQLASTTSIFTNVNLINTSTSSRIVQLKAIRADGSIEGDPVEITLAVGAQLSADASQIFEFGASLLDSSQPAQSDFVGSLVVEADGDGVVGDVIFGDTAELGFAASLPLQTQTFLEAVFSQVADIPGSFFTGLAFFNPGTVDAEVTVEIVSADGTTVGSASRTLQAGKRLSELTSELVPDSVGQAGGYVLIRSDRPLIAQMLFGKLSQQGITLFSAVPPSVIR